MSSAHLMARTLLFSIPALVGRAGFHCMTVHFCSFLWFGGWECEWGDQVIATYWLICEFDTGSVQPQEHFLVQLQYQPNPLCQAADVGLCCSRDSSVACRLSIRVVPGARWPTCPMLRPASQCCPHRDPQRSSSRSFVHALTWGINLAIMTNVGLPRNARHRHVAFSLLSRNTLVNRNCGILLSSQHFWFPMIIRDGFSTHQSSAHVLQILQFVFNKTRQSRKDYRLQSQSVMVGCKQRQKTVTLTSNVAINPSKDREMSAKKTFKPWRTFAKQTHGHSFFAVANGITSVSC